MKIQSINEYIHELLDDAISNDELQFVTMSEFEDWTKRWLSEKFLYASQEPGVIPANIPICFFMRDMAKKGVYPKDAKMEEIKRIFYTIMLRLYRLILKSDEWPKHLPHFKSNLNDVIQYAQQYLSELEDDSESVNKHGYKDGNAIV